MEFNESTSNPPSSEELSEEIVQNYSFEYLSSSAILFRSVTGMKIVCFNTVFYPIIQTYFEEKRNQLGPHDKLSCPDEAVMLLVYLKQGTTYLELGRLFNLSESRTRRIINEDVFNIAILLEEIIQWKNLQQQQHLNEEDFIGFSSVIGIIDATEIKINRPKNAAIQRKYYSGKSKIHCLKFQIIVQPEKGEIMHVGKLSKGNRHDFKMIKKSGIFEQVGNEESLMGDSGYQGMDEYCNAIVPKKKTRGRLSQEDSQNNQKISKKRVIVEHAFAKMKRFKILRNKWTGKISNHEFLEKIVQIVAVIVNLNSQN